MGKYCDEKGMLVNYKGLPFWKTQNKVDYYQDPEHTFYYSDYVGNMLYPK